MPAARVPAALEVRDVVKVYQQRRGAVRAVDGATFSAAAGRITAVLGPNGAGKTTTLECCTGLRTPDSGEIRVLGRDRSSPSDAAWLRERVGVMVQSGGLPQAPTAREVLLHVQKLYRDPADPLELARELALEPVLGTSVRRLSGGERQRVAVACALLGRPQLAFLDEPSSGVDPHARRSTWRMLRRLRDRGCAVVLTTHHLDEAEELADHVVMMDRGRVVAAGTVPELASGFSLVLALPPGEPEDAASLDQAAAVLEGTRHISAPPVRGERQVSAVTDRSDAEFVGGIATALGSAGLGRLRISIARRTLESAYLERTGRDALTAEVE